MSELLASDGPIPLLPHYALGNFGEACIAVDLLRPAFHAIDGAVAWLIESLPKRKNDSDKLRRERRRKERAK